MKSLKQHLKENHSFAEINYLKERIHYLIWGPEVEWYLDPIERPSGDWSQQLTYLRELEDAIGKVYMFESRGRDVKPALMELYNLVPHLKG